MNEWMNECMNEWMNESPFFWTRIMLYTALQSQNPWKTAYFTSEHIYCLLALQSIMIP